MRMSFTAVLLSIVLAYSGTAGAAFDTPVPDFGTNGIAQFTFGPTTPSSGSQLAIDGAVDAQQRVYVLGFVADSGGGTSSTSGVVRLTSGGLVDTTFGNNGFLALPFYTYSDGTQHLFQRIAVSPDGNYLFVNVSIVRSVVMGKIRVDGAPDTTFGTGGFAQFEVEGFDLTAQGYVMVQPDGRPIWTGTGSIGACCSPTSTHALAVRFTIQGMADATFGTGGLAVGPSRMNPNQPTAGRSFLDYEGRPVVLVGEGSSASSTSTAFATRFTADGLPLARIDRSNQTGLSAFLMGHAKADGTLVLLHRSFDGLGAATHVIVEYDQNGLPVPTFGTGGVQSVPLPTPSFIVLASPVNAGGPLLLIGTNGALAHVLKIQGSDDFATPALPAPTGLAAAAGNATVQLTWNAVPGAQTYRVYQGTVTGMQGDTPVQIGLTSTTASITGLANGTAYFFTVRAAGPTGVSEPSNEASATPSAPILLAPSGLTATPGVGQVQLAWTGSLGAGAYNVYAGTVAGSPSATPVLANATSTQATISGLTIGTTYFFTVKAVYAVPLVPLPLESAPSNEASAAPLPAPPAAPGNVVATPGDASIVLRWDATPGALRYHVYQGITPGGQGAAPVRTGVTASTVTIGGLTNGTTYYFLVRSENDGGLSGASTEASASPQAPVTPPSPNSGGGGGGGAITPEVLLLLLLAGWARRVRPLRVARIRR